MPGSAPRIFRRKMDPPKWTPKPEIAHCWKCHGSDDMWHDKVSLNNQQGHMDCNICHQDHTKKKKQAKKKMETGYIHILSLSGRSDSSRRSASDLTGNPPFDRLRVTIVMVSLFVPANPPRRIDHGFPDQVGE